MASQKPNKRQPNSTKRPRTYTNEEKERKNALQRVSHAKKAQKSAHFDALEKEMKSEIERLKACLVSCEETLCGANKRIQYLKKSKDCTFF